MTRWKPYRRQRYRRPRWRHRGGLRRGTTLPTATLAVPLGITLVMARNNLWGMGYLGGRLAWSLSAGATPPGAGSHRGGRQAATAVVNQTGEWSTGVTNTIPLPSQDGPLRTKFAYHHYRFRHRRRWRSRSFIAGRLTRVATLAVKLIGLAGRIRWKELLSLLYPYAQEYTRRVTIATAFFRSHNGIRSPKDRRI